MRISLVSAGWRWQRALLVALAMVLVASAGISATRYYLAYRDLKDAKDLLLTVESSLREEGLDAPPELLDRSDQQLQSARRKSARADRLLDHDPIFQVARRLPWAGKQVKAAGDLAEIGVDAAEIGLHGVTALRTFDQLKEGEQGRLGQKAVAFLEAVRPDTAAMEERLTATRSRLDHLKGEPLIAPLSDAVYELDAKLPWAEDLVQTYTNADAFAPGFLGFDRPKTYLVLAQDNNELFPTGGFIPVYGLVTLDHGVLTRKSFQPVEKLNGRWQERTGGEYVEPPGPVKRYFLRDHTWNLGLSNWSPDFPTAARQAEFFFTRASSEPIDGVIAINSITLEELLKALDSVTIEDYGVTVTAENINEETLRLTRPSQNAGGERYRFTGFLADAVFDAALATPSDRWPKMLDALDKLGERKQLLFYSNDPDFQLLVRNLGWDGAIEDTQDDYLMAVDASVNSTKLNLVLDEAMEAAVALGAAGTASHRVTIAYKNGLSEWEQRHDAQLVTETMGGGFYGGYLRVYAPSDADFIDVVQDNEPVGFEEITTENGKTSAGRFFGLAGDEETKLTFLYDVPNAVRSAGDSLEYRLLIQKQPGTRAIPLKVVLSLPDGGKFISADLDGRAIPAHGGRLDVGTDLGVDREILVRYVPGS